MRAFVEAVEAKDPHTKGHSERIAHYAVFIAKELGLKKKETELIRQAALIYDVGKILLLVAVGMETLGIVLIRSLLSLDV